MPKHPDFIKIHARFIKQYGKEKGNDLYFAWLKKKGYDDTKPFPKGKEKKEFMCHVVGLEVKELESCFHVEGLIATTHVDNVNMEEGVDISDKITKETLESFASQMNANKEARIMGVHHSEGHPYMPEYFGEADVEKLHFIVILSQVLDCLLFFDTKLSTDGPMTHKKIKNFQRDKPQFLNSLSSTY